METKRRPVLGKVSCGDQSLLKETYVGRLPVPIPTPWVPPFSLSPLSSLNSHKYPANSSFNLSKMLDLKRVFHSTVQNKPVQLKYESLKNESITIMSNQNEKKDFKQKKTYNEF